MNRRQLQQKIQRRQNKASKKSASHLAVFEKSAMVEEPAAASNDSTIISTTFHARVRISARQMRISIPQLAALNAGLKPGMLIEVSIKEAA